MQVAIRVNKTSTFFILCILILCKFTKKFLEWIADGKMKSHTVLESGDVVVTGFTGVVRHVQGDTPVKTEYQEGEIIADADSGSQGDAVKEMVQTEFGIGAGFVFSQQPDVACIQKCGSI